MQKSGKLFHTFMPVFTWPAFFHTDATRVGCGHAGKVTMGNGETIQDSSRVVWLFAVFSR
jgi:hypothetical protein